LGKTLHIIFFFLALFPLSAQTIAELEFEGNKKTKTSFLTKISRTQLGSALDSIVLQTDVQQFRRLPGIAYAYYEITEVQPEQVKVTFHIEENFTIIPSTNIWTTDQDEFAYRLGLYEFNALGQNIIFGGFCQRDIYNSVGVNFRAPFLFNKHVGLAVNFQDWTTLEPVFLENGTANYKYNNVSYEVLGLYQFNFFHRVEAGIQFFTEDYEYKSGATSAEVPQALEVDKMLYKAIYEYNSVERDYYFLEGWVNTFNFQYVISQDIILPDFLIGWNDVIYYKRIGNKGNWASRLRVGLSSNNETPFAPFAVDNNLNIRGVGNTIDRGTGAIVLNTEYRHTLLEKGWFVIQGNAFLDGGSWRNPGGTLSDFWESENLRIYPGAGVRFIHKRIFNTVFRIDYGIGVTENSTQGFVIGIGQYF